MAKEPNLASAREATVAETARNFSRHRKKLRVHVHDGPIKSVRTEKYRGHKIKITATYDIRIDGRRVGGHMEVGNDGHVHNHGLPNYLWGSMVDMCKQFINSFPEDFPPKGQAPAKPVLAHKGKAKKKLKKKLVALKEKSGAGKGRRG